MINIANINENDRKALFQNTAAKMGTWMILHILIRLENCI